MLLGYRALYCCRLALKVIALYSDQKHILHNFSIFKLERAVQSSRIQLQEGKLPAVFEVHGIGQHQLSISPDGLCK